MTKPQEPEIVVEPRSTALANQQSQGGAVVAQSDTVGFLQMIERASRDPSVDIDKMERLLQMHERMLNRDAETKFNAALAKMQIELPEIPEKGAIKNKSGGVQSTYMLWEDLNKIIKPILSRHGFALTFRTGNLEKAIVVTGILSHEAGHSVSSTMHLPIDDSGSKNSVQGLGSSTSYGQRYVARALLNLTSRGEDNDGGGGSNAKTMDADVKQDYMDKLERTANRKEAESLWTEINGTCTKIGDVAAYDEFRAVMGRKLKSFAAAAPKAPASAGSTTPSDLL